MGVAVGRGRDDHPVRITAASHRTGADRKNAPPELPPRVRPAPIRPRGTQSGRTWRADAAKEGGAGATANTSR